MLIRKFSKCDINVKLCLFPAYCAQFYGCSTWKRFKVTVRRRFEAAYVKCIKCLFGFERRHSMTKMLCDLGLPNFNTVIHNAQVRLTAVWTFITRCLYCVEWTQYSIRLESVRYMQQAHPSPEGKRYLDRFQIFCRAHQVTDRQTTLLGRSQQAASTYVVKERKGRVFIYRHLYIMYISKRSGMDHTVLPANTPCLPFLHKRSPAAPTKNVLLLKFCFSVRACETSCFTYCIRWGIVSRDPIVDGDWLHAADWCHALWSTIR